MRIDYYYKQRKSSHMTFCWQLAFAVKSICLGIPFKSSVASHQVINQPALAACVHSKHIIFKSREWLGDMMLWMSWFSKLCPVRQLQWAGAISCWWKINGRWRSSKIFSPGVRIDQMFQHWFRKWLGTVQATNHYLTNDGQFTDAHMRCHHGEIQPLGWQWLEMYSQDNSLPKSIPTPSRHLGRMFWNQLQPMHSILQSLK